MTDLIGTPVLVPGANRGNGILRYVGQIRGKPGTFGGIELQGPIAASRGKNSGDVDGVKYFDVTQPMTGLFLPWDRLRAANPSLPPSERLKSRSLSSKRDSVATPTPSRRSSASPHVLNGNGGIGESGRPFSPAGRPFSRAGSLSREFRSAESLSSVNSASPVTEHVMDIPQKAPDTSSSSSRAELVELRAQLEQKTREFDRKETILLDLQATVDQLHPVLEDYEKNLEEKDRKLKKQKNDYDRAREEWRSSLDLMLSSQQEAENLYEMQISDLKEEIRTLVAKSGLSNGSVLDNDKAEAALARADALADENALLKGKLGEITHELEIVRKEKDELLSFKAQAEKAASSTTNVGAVSDAGGIVNDDDKELIESLKSKVDMLTQDVTSMEIVLQDAQAKARAKSVEIAELEIKLEEFTSQEVNELSDKIVGLSMDDWEKDKLQYKEKIEALEQKLKAATQDSSDVTESAKANELELTKLRENERLKASEISQLHEKIKALEQEKSKQSSTAGSLQDSGNLSKIDALTKEQEGLKLTIQDLEKELETRPAYDDKELTELQNSLEIVESLHKDEIKSLQKEFDVSKAKNTKMEKELLSLQQKLAELSTKVHEPVASKGVSDIGSTISKNISVASKDVYTAAAPGELPIHKPAKEIDPSEGRDDWCGLCERDGHDSLNCPYENDMF
ncbi:hypothetical protein JCM33374_g4211 [Metschnikowia sp. JCM 33374]|nr:hypothetical protein JCM33374_g4211 [Metschnikowia sp. JCM 33374]